METNIVNLRDAKWEKDAPFKVAETRLGNRHQRPNVEMCRDEPSHRYDFDILLHHLNCQNKQEKMEGKYRDNSLLSQACAIREFLFGFK